MKVSVLICTYKRKQLLEKCLKSLIDYAFELPDEIVIVDGEKGELKEVVERWKAKFPNIKLVPTENINLANSRNKGLPYCSGEIIALTDDDCLVEKDWVQKIKRLHKEHPEAGVIGGRVKSVGDRLIDKVSDLVIFPFPKKPAYLRTVAGANCSYKIDAIKKVSGYDENLFRGEDVDFNWRIIKAGYKIYYDPNLVVYHHHRSTWKGLFYQLFMYGRNYYLVRKKWPDMYCVCPHKIRNFKDILKLINFFLTTLYQPLLMSFKIRGFTNKIISYPFLIIANTFWKLGIVKEAFSKKVNLIKNGERTLSE